MSAAGVRRRSEGLAVSQAARAGDAAAMEPVALAGRGRRGRRGHVAEVRRRLTSVWRSGPLASFARPGAREMEHAVILESVARSLRAGLSLTLALDEAGRAPGGGFAATELHRAVALLDVGLDVGAVVDAWAASAPDPSRVVAGAALGLGAELGGAQAQSLDGAAAGLRDRAELIREVRALTSQARASAAVMVLAPIAFAGYSWATDGRVGRVMFTTGLGWVCLVGGLALDGLGAAWMARLVGRVR